MHTHTLTSWYTEQALTLHTQDNSHSQHKHVALRDTCNVPIYVCTHCQLTTAHRPHTQSQYTRASNPVRTSTVPTHSSYTERGKRPGLDLGAVSLGPPSTQPRLLPFSVSPAWSFRSFCLVETQARGAAHLPRGQARVGAGGRELHCLCRQTEGHSPEWAWGPACMRKGQGRGLGHKEGR